MGTPQARVSPAIVVLTIVALTGLRSAADVREFSEWGMPENLGPVVNSPYVENTPCLSRDGLSLYFVSYRPGGFGSADVYVSQRATTDDAWGTPVNLGSNINTAEQEYYPALSPDGHRLYFSRFGPSGYDLYVSHRHNKKDAFGWEPAVPVPELNIAEFNDVALEFFEDEATSQLMAYFSSNRTGDANLFMTWLQDDGTFAAPTLVSELNTTANDRLATVRADGLEVLFNRGLGAVVGPIWTATRSTADAPWSEPVVLGAPINVGPIDQTPRLSFDGTELYFMSTRGGEQDLWVSRRIKLKGTDGH